MMKIAFNTNAGMVRNNNEDNLLINEKFNLFAVADGMGGHNAGEVASKLAVETLQRTIVSQLDFTPATQSGGEVDPNLLTVEDNEKKQASLTNKAATLAKGAGMVSKLLEGGKYTIGLRME